MLKEPALALALPPPHLQLAAERLLLSTRVHQREMAQHGHSPPLPAFGAPGSPHRALNDSLYSRLPPRPHSTVAASMPLGTALSPPYAPGPALPGYRLRTQSPTPDRIGDHPATRPYRSSSGSLMQRPGTASSSFYSHNDEAAERARRTSLGGILHRPDSEPAMPAAPAVERPARAAGSYDTRPPAMSSAVRPAANARAQGGRDSSSRSPDLRRSLINGPEPRSLAAFLSIGPESMQRQDSAQSQTSLLGDRPKPRQFSPFASSVASQAMSTASAPPDGLARKGSDELSQHRAVLGLAHDSRRGRYSPVPQAVKGAQAQTPVPDAGINPFKLGEASRLSEENLMKMSRSSSGISKRPRKYDDDDRGPRKKTKYGHSYKVGLESDLPRQGTPLVGVNGAGRGTPLAGVNGAGRGTTPSGPPKKTIRVASIIAAAKRFPRRHLGNYIYSPEVSKSDCFKPGFDKFDVSIKPNLLPSFTEADQVNCTYTVRVSRIWLQARERSLICKEAYLWGSGVYTDDSDVVAAAMHSGYISSQPPDNVDRVLLDRVMKAQNAQIDGLVDLPDRPVEPAAGTDAVITLVVLPALERYPASSRFGLCSREWPGPGAKAPHDGVSFAILKVDFVAGGVEGRRMGRTGKEKRKRMEQEQQDRLQSQRLLKVMLDQARKKLKEQGKPVSKKPHPLSDGPALDVGHTPGDWLRQADAGKGD
ncbi:hypothetical protein DV737_g2715, partial [Chaetothyriales sp. CBS 132003]